MAKHYSIKDALWQIANLMLAGYFKTKGLLKVLDFATMKEGKPNELCRTS